MGHVTMIKKKNSSPLCSLFTSPDCLQFGGMYTAGHFMSHVFLFKLFASHLTPSTVSELGFLDKIPGLTLDPTGFLPSNHTCKANKYVVITRRMSDLMCRSSAVCLQKVLPRSVCVCVCECRACSTSDLTFYLCHPSLIHSSASFSLAYFFSAFDTHSLSPLPWGM